MTGDSSIATAMEMLQSHGKLDRDKGAVALGAYFDHVQSSSKSDDVHVQLSSFQDSLLSFLSSHKEDEEWEHVFARLSASELYIRSGLYSEEFLDKILNCALSHIEHSEFRVRIAAGQLLGALCKSKPGDLYKICESRLMRSISANLERHIPADPTDKLLVTIQGGLGDCGFLSADQMDHLAEVQKKNAQQIFHDTAGWKCLETSMKGLQAVIEGCGKSFQLYLGNELLELVFDTLKHTNRFVRETGYYVCAAVARFGVSSSEAESSGLFAAKLADHLHTGLSDNWSQVRLAASVATRQFFEDVKICDAEKYFATLLPPMCLNRYYLAEGVRLYNTETWRIVLGTEGRSYVEKYINEVVSFYVQQTQSDNHAVREAACHCMAELGVKINKGAVRNHVPGILNALHVCFKDESWPVRDTACVACGNFVLAFPDESKVILHELFPLFYGNLCDPIPSVRQGAALALCNVAHAYPDETLPTIFEKITEGLKQVEYQPASSERFQGFDKGPATYGVVKRLRDNDLALHSNQQMYSCGSLAPKMNRGGGGCSNHSFKRPSEPWEMTDGCIYLLGEMSLFPQAHEKVAKCLPALIAAVHHKHYIQHVHLLETLCRELPVIAKGIGKRYFKPYLEEFFDPIFCALSCDNALTNTAATECLEAMSKYLGPNILRGRIEQYNFGYLQHLEKALMNGSAPSPFGMR